MGLLDAPTAAVGGVLDPIAAKIKNPFTTRVKNTDRAQDFPKGFYFVELVNGKERPKDAVRLAGNMLPHIPFEYGGTQRITADYYPGNSEPAVQVLGPKEGDVVIKGKFKDKRYKDEDLYGVSYEIAKLCDAIRIRGNLLRITLGEWQRYGYLEESKFRMNKLSEIEYELKFLIVGFNKPRNCKFADNTKTVPFDINKDLISDALAFQDTYSAIPSTMPRSLADVLNGAISDVATAINLVTGFVDTVVSTAEDVQASANRAIGLIKNARANISKFKRRVGALALGFSSLSTEARAASNFKSVLTNQSHIMNSISALAGLSALLARLQSQFEAISKTTPLARYKVKRGDTLQKISIKYYNDAGSWEKIYAHNKLTTTALAEGLLLEIPRV